MSESIGFEEKVKQLKKLQIDICELKEREEQLKDDVKRYMFTNGIESTRVGYLRVKCQERTFYRFDTALFKKEHEALYNSYLKSTTMRILQIR